MTMKHVTLSTAPFGGKVFLTHGCSLDRSSPPCEASPGVFWVKQGTGELVAVAIPQMLMETRMSTVAPLLPQEACWWLLQWQLKGRQRMEGDHWTSSGLQKSKSITGPGGDPQEVGSTGKFIEMKELMQDNISLAAQLEELQQGSSSLQVIGAACLCLREVASITAWCYCFLAYAATTTSDPVTREQLAYEKLIIRQAQSQGGLAFLDYNRAFFQKKVADPSLRWNTLNPSLLASTTYSRQHCRCSSALCSEAFCKNIPS